MIHASQVLVFIGLIAWGLAVGMPAPSDAADMRQLGETATRLPRGRIATSVEGGHTCVVVADGTVRCWGLNGSGQLGDRTINTPLGSVQVVGISTAIAVTTGKDHSCALLVDATVRCWGANSVGQLGNGSFTPSLEPVTVRDITNRDITNAVSISGGSNHTCVRRSDGTIACWGSNEFGQIGDGSLGNGNNRPVAVQVRDINDARMVSVGSTHTCAVRANGTVACWGGNGVGQLGRGFDGDNRPTPDTVPGLESVWLVASGHRYSCAVVLFGFVTCWGFNDTGQLGDGSTENSSIPIRIAIADLFGNLPATFGIAPGNGHTCVLGSNGNTFVHCWGQNAAGELGRPATEVPQIDQTAPVGGIPNTVEVAAGLDRTCILNASDVVFCWGENSAGQLGNGSTQDVVVPTAVGGLAGAVSARGVAAGLRHSCAWRADGTIACWGFARTLGNGSTLGSAEPVAVRDGDSNNLSSNNFSVVAGDEHTCTVRATGLTACWGNNFAGQVDPSVSVDAVLTANNTISVSGLIGIAAGREHSIVLILTNSVGFTMLGWGNDDALHLQSPHPNLPGFFRGNSGELGPVAIAAGGEHTCVLQVRGTVRCFGSNEFGQLGSNNSSTGAFTGGQLVQGIDSAVAIAAGDHHTCALLVNGTVRCWGANHSRQLGDETTQERRTPVGVPGIVVGQAVGIVAGGAYTCVLGVRGDVRCWGDNSQGQLGDNSFIDRPEPVAVQRATRTVKTFLEGLVVTATAPLNQVVALVGGGTHVCAVRVNGQPVCWGNNANGRLGDGTTTDRPHAMGVASFLANIDPAAELNRNGRKAELTALVNCPEGARFSVRLDVQQDHAKGHGHEDGKCAGGVVRVPVKVSAQGRARFDEGPADARAVIDVRLKGEVIDHQEWHRVVNLETIP
jgi:alpha-tubulin suppressor-like RCC1 family protein